MKKEFEAQLEGLELKMNSAEEQKKAVQREKLSTESEFEKQKALLDQKVEFLEKALEDSNRREKEMS